MKKFLIIMAMVLIAAAVNAASVSWSGTNVKADPGGNAATSYTIYLVDASVISSDSLAGEIAAGNLSSLKPTGNAVVATTTGLAQGGEGIGRWATTASLPSSYEVGTKPMFYTVILNDQLADAAWYLITDTNTETIPATGNLSMDFGDQVGVEWQPIKPVPEPTSGLLIMLGVAALALKRKKA